MWALKRPYEDKNEIFINPTTSQAAFRGSHHYSASSMRVRAGAVGPMQSVVVSLRWSPERGHIIQEQKSSHHEEESRGYRLCFFDVTNKEATLPNEGNIGSCLKQRLKEKQYSLAKLWINTDDQASQKSSLKQLSHAISKSLCSKLPMVLHGWENRERLPKS